MARKAGLEYYPRAVDMLSDDKIFEFMMIAGDGADRSDAAYAALGRLDELYAQIYTENYYIVLDDRKRARLAHHLGLSRDAFDSFVDMCVGCDLFDKGFYESASVLTSRGLQERYLNGKKLSRSKVAGEWWLISDNLGDSRSFSENPGNSPKNAAEDKEKEKGKGKEEEEEDGGGDVAASMPLPCMAVPEEGRVCIDLNGGPHQTMLGCVLDSYRQAGGKGTPEQYCAKVSGLCPPSCRGAPDRAGACFDLIMQALKTYDPRKTRDPWPLTRTILENDR